MEMLWPLPGTVLMAAGLLQMFRNRGLGTGPADDEQRAGRRRGQLLFAAGSALFVVGSFVMGWR
jgi:hypothetical protein